MTNSLKHACAQHAEVLLRYEPNALEVVVTDDGCGGDPSPDGGHGLIGLRERVAVYRGQLWAGPTDPTGFELRARLLIEEP